MVVQKKKGEGENGKIEPQALEFSTRVHFSRL